MRYRILTLGSFTALLSLGGGVLSAAPAHAIPPGRSSFSFDFSTPDFLGSPPTGDPAAPQCAFRVTGSWHVTVAATDYFDRSTGNITMSIWRVEIAGTLSDPISGKSVPDSYNADMIKFYYAPDGSVVESFENESRDDPYLHMAEHAVSDATGTIVKDAGRDFLPVDRHPMDVTPLCDVLS